MRRVFVIVALMSSAAAFAQEAKEGPGKDLFMEKCTQCHGVQDVLGKRNNIAGWEATVRQMVSLGAPLTEDEVKTVSTYLATQYGQ
jgi:mono/diheme cytochrome c family protein